MSKKNLYKRIHLFCNAKIVTLALLPLLDGCKSRNFGNVKKLSASRTFEGVQTLEGKNSIARALRMSFANFLENNINQANSIAERLSHTERSQDAFQELLKELQKSAEEESKSTVNSLLKGHWSPANALFGWAIKEFEKSKTRGLVGALTLLDPQLSAAGIDSAKFNIELRYILNDYSDSRIVDYTKGAGGFGAERNSVTPQEFTKYQKLRDSINLILPAVQLSKPEAAMNMKHYLNPKNQKPDPELTPEDKSQIDRVLSSKDVARMLKDLGFNHPPEELKNSQDIVTKKNKILSAVAQNGWTNAETYLLPEDNVWNKPMTYKLERFNEWKLEQELLPRLVNLHDSGQIKIQDENLRLWFAAQASETPGDNLENTETPGVAQISTFYFVQPRSIAVKGSSENLTPQQAQNRRRIADRALDWFLTVGTFQLTVSTSAEIVKFENDLLTIRFVSSYHVYDKYDWHAGLGTMLFDNWCERLQYFIAKLKGAKQMLPDEIVQCSSLERQTSVKVNDTIIGRLHVLGLAREFELYGTSTPSERIVVLPLRRAIARSSTGKTLIEALLEANGDEGSMSRADIFSL